MTKLVKQPTAKPTRKVAAATVGAFIAVCLIWAGEAMFGTPAPLGFESAATAFFTGLIAAGGSFVGGWFAREKGTGP